MNSSDIIDSYLDEASEEKISKQHEEVWNSFRKCSRGKIKKEAERVMRGIRSRIRKNEKDNVETEVAKLKTLLSLYQAMEHMKPDEELPEWNKGYKK
jgi:hypothetical protein